MPQRGVDGAFRQSSSISDGSNAHWNGFPVASNSLAIEMEINEVGGGPLIVRDQVAHQHVEDVVVNGNGSFEARHKKRKK